jgi:hypothetical protein
MNSGFGSSASLPALRKAANRWLQYYDPYDQNAATNTYVPDTL